jgi:hypothetical protein
MLWRILLAVLLIGPGLSAQDARSYRSLSRGEPGCPRPDSGGGGAHRSIDDRPLLDTTSDALFAKGQRRQAATFGVTDVNNVLQTVGDQKGRILLIGFWSTRCDPAKMMLQEFRNFQKQVAGNPKFKVTFWPVHFEPWSEVLGFLRTKPDLYSGVEVQRLGLGEHGLTQLVEDLNTLPTLVLIDKEGGIAAVWAGYREGQILKRVNQLLAER